MPGEYIVDLPALPEHCQPCLVVPSRTIPLHPSPRAVPAPHQAPFAGLSIFPSPDLPLDTREEEPDAEDEQEHTRDNELENGSAQQQHGSVEERTTQNLTPPSSPKTVPENPVDEIPQNPVNEIPQNPVDGILQNSMEQIPHNPVNGIPQNPVDEIPHNTVDEVPNKEDLSLDSLARFISQQLHSPEAHIQPPYSANMECLVRQEHILSVEEALAHKDLQVPDVLSMGKLDPRNAHFMEGLSPSKRQMIYCGFGSEQGPEERINISIEKDAPRTETGMVTYDVDSYIACLTSLAAARQGIKCILTQRPTPSIRASLHLGTFPAYQHPEDGCGDIKQVHVTLNKIPHISLGRLVGDDEFEVILCFPHALREEQQTTRLTDKWWEIWLDEVFLPAYFETCPASGSQAYPASVAEAKALSTKRHAEDMRRGKPQQARIQLLAYRLRPSQLAALCDRILEKIALPGHHMFKDPIPLVIAKGLKDQFRASRWTTMHSEFFSFLDGILDRTRTVWAFYDWAKEICPASTSVQHSRYERPGEVLLWDYRYLERFYTLLRNLDPAYKHRFQRYHAYFLKGVGDASLEPAQKSLLWKHGLRFVQTYNSVKNLFTAGDFTTGTNEAMADLAVDHAILRAFQVLGKGIAVDRQTLMNGYLHMKHHVDVTLVGNRQKSAGLREEFRGGEDLFAAVDAYMREQERQPETSTTSTAGWATPGGFFTVQSQVFSQWARWNFNRLCFGFESVYNIASGRAVAWEHSRMMTMFLRCIPCFLGKGTVEERPRFWYDRYPRRENMLPKEDPHGFAWFADKIDWETLTFDWRFGGQLGFNFTYTEGRFKRWSLIRTFKDVMIRIQHTQPYFVHWGHDPNCYAILAGYLHQLCAHAFRVDVFTQMQKCLAEDRVEDALAGDVPLCFEAISAALDPDQGTKIRIARGGQHKLQT
jgi:hypothetical protein